jgi:hypothetical protein
MEISVKLVFAVNLWLYKNKTDEKNRVAAGKRWLGPTRFNGHGGYCHKRIWLHNLQFLQ